MRIGSGYDIHRLVPDRKLFLGGICIPHETGLLGHSDADVLIHAICDALLGAAALGDIGIHFPDTDPKYKDICSVDLLIETNRLIREQGYRLLNLDATIVAQAPKLSPYMEQMKNKLALCMETDSGRINIKATTMEGLGNIGKGEAIAAHCIVLLDS